MGKGNGKVRSQLQRSRSLAFRQAASELESRLDDDSVQSSQKRHDALVEMLSLSPGSDAERQTLQYLSACIHTKAYEFDAAREELSLLFERSPNHKKGRDLWARLDAPQVEVSQQSPPQNSQPKYTQPPRPDFYEQQPVHYRPQNHRQPVAEEPAWAKPSYPTYQPPAQSSEETRWPTAPPSQPRYEPSSSNLGSIPQQPSYPTYQAPSEPSLGGPSYPTR